MIVAWRQTLPKAPLGMGMGLQQVWLGTKYLVSSRYSNVTFEPLTGARKYLRQTLAHVLQWVPGLDHSLWASSRAVL
jgi:hypothetical protein